MPSDAPTVFISYNRADRKWAEWMAWTLEEAGFSVAVQPWDFHPGHNFVLEMQNATARARHTVIVLSPSFLAADFTQPEWAAAFVRDPRGSNRTLIPVRVQECWPEGLLGQNVYADLVGLGEEEASAALLGAFADRAKPDRRPSFPGGAGTKAIAGDRPPFPGTRVTIAKLPLTGETFVARDDELAHLDAAWADPSANVIIVVAMGGAGKSALVNRWLDGLKADGWRGAERVLGWTFYSQGTDATGVSSEAFTEFALDWLGYQGDPIVSPRKKGEELARLVRASRTLLVLDGLEPLQHPPGAQTGRLKDPAMQALVRELAAKNLGLCVITTRLPVADVSGKTGASMVDLEKLPPSAGAELLRRLGVEGSEKELEKTSEEFGGHGLALTLLGTYLRDICDGDVRRRREVPLLDEGIEQGGHTRRVMESYEKWLGAQDLQVLHLIGLFDRSAEAEAVASLRAEPAIPALTEGLGAGDEARWRQALARLRQARLLAADDGTGVVDAHPLVREYFGERLRASQPKAWRTGHGRLYEHYRQAVPEFPDTLEEMLPLYTAVVHGCRAGRVQKALDEVYKRRIQRGSEAYSWTKLGVFGAELRALAGFFDRPWDRPSDQLSAADQAWILNQAGFALRALGRLPEAVQPMRAGLDAGIAQKDWKEAAIRAGNLSELTLTLGEVASAVQAGEESVELADRSGDAFIRMVNRTTLADALHQAGRWEESASVFRKAEAMQAERQPQYPRLYSLQGYRYCDLLLAMAEPEDGSGLDLVRQAAPADSDAIGRRGLPYKKACEEVRERAEEALQIVLNGSRSLLDVALGHLSLGRARIGLALTSGAPPDFTEAAEYLDRAVDGLRQAGTEHELPRGLLARAVLRRLRATTDAAATDLREAQEIAERGHMRLFEADVHLEWTRLCLQTGDREDARRHFERASELLTSTGYGRREREVAYLEGRFGGLSEPPTWSIPDIHSRREPKAVKELVDPLLFAFRLVIAGHASPELLQTLEARPLRDAANKAGQDRNAQGSLRKTLESLEEEQFHIDPNPLWLAWMRATRAERLDALEEELLA